MTDLAQLGLSLDAKPMLDGLGKVDAALTTTAKKAEALATKIKTATGQMATAFSKVKDGGTDKQAASLEKMNFAIEHQAKAYRALLAVMREDAAVAKSSAAQRILLNSAFASATAEINKATVAGAKNLAGLRSETAVTTSLAVAQGGLTASEKQLLDAKIRKNAVTKAYTDSVRAEIAGATQQVALSNAHVAAYHRETAAIKQRNAALAAERAMQTAMGRDIIAMQGRRNASLGLSSAGKDLFAPYAADPKVLAASKQQVALSAEHTAALKREEAATKSLAGVEAARARQAMALRMQPILSTGSVGLPTKATSAFNQPEGASYTASGIASVDRMRESLARLKVEEAALHSARASGAITSREYARGMEEVTKATNLATAGNTRARGVFRQTASAVASATFEITGALFGITAALSALTSPATFGFKLLSTLEDTKLGLSGILISMGRINGEVIKLPKALELADGMTKRLQQNALKYGVDIKALADTTRSILAVGLGANMGLKEIEEIALFGAIAVKTIGLEAKQSVQEIRDLVAGGIQAGSSTLAVALGVDNKMVKEWRELGTVYTELKTRFVGFIDTAILKQDTLSGAWTIFAQKVQLLFANSAAFDMLKAKLIEVSNALGKINKDTGNFEFDPKIVGMAEDYWRAFKAALATIKEVGKAIVALTPLVIELGKAFLILKTVNLAATLGKGLLEVGAAAATALGAVIKQTGEASSKVGALAGTLNGIGKSPIVQVIAVSIAWEGGQWIGEQLNKYFGDFFARELEKINKLIYNFGKNIKATLADALAAVFQWGPMSRLLGIPEFFSRMADEIRRGGDAAASAAAAQAKRIARIAKQYDSVQSADGLRSSGKVDGGHDRLLAEEMRMLGGEHVTGIKPPADPDKGPKGSRAVDPQIAFMAALKKERETLGMGEEALKRYEIAKMKLSASNRRLADTYVTTIFAFKAEQEAAKLANEEFDRSLALIERKDAAIEDAIRKQGEHTKQLEFETSLMGKNNEERHVAIGLRELETAGLELSGVELQKRITLLREQYAMEQAILADKKSMADLLKKQEDLAAAAGKIWENFTQNVQKNMGDQFYDFMQGKFDDIGSAFKSMIDRMVADAMAAQLSKYLFAEGGVLGQSSPFGRFANSLIGGAVGSISGFGAGASSSIAMGSLGTNAFSQQSMMLASQVFHQGGMVGGSAPERQVPAALFSNAPRFHSGGIIGSDEVPIIARRGERVQTEQQQKESDKTQRSAVNVTFNIATPDANSFKASQGQITANVSRVLQRARRDM